METIKITSAQNPCIKHVCKLRDRRCRELEQLTLLEGYRELTRGLEYGMEIIECYFAPVLFLGDNEFALLDELKHRGATVAEVAPHLLEKMAYRERPEGLIAIARMKKHHLGDLKIRPDGLYLIAEAVEKPGNLGSILRSADAAGVDGLIICNKCTDIYNPNVIRASTGALFCVPLAEATTSETIDWLSRNNIKTLAATPHTDKIYTEIDMTCGIAIVVGTEQHGLSDHWLQNANINICIPMLGRIDSLNVATAATILLYEAARQRKWHR